MARRASNRALTRALQVNVVLVRNREDIVALVRLDGLDVLALRVTERDFDPAVSDAAYPVPGSGRWIPLWPRTSDGVRATRGVATNVRLGAAHLADVTVAFTGMRGITDVRDTPRSSPCGANCLAHMSRRLARSGAIGRPLSGRVPPHLALRCPTTASVHVAAPMARPVGRDDPVGRFRHVSVWIRHL